VTLAITNPDTVCTTCNITRRMRRLIVQQRKIAHARQPTANVAMTGEETAHHSVPHVAAGVEDEVSMALPTATATTTAAATVHPPAVLHHPTNPLAEAEEVRDRTSTADRIRTQSLEASPPRR
jgi:hypothetical protein